MSETIGLRQSRWRRFAGRWTVLRAGVWMLALVPVTFLLWAAFFEIDELTRGEGKVIPSRRIQTVQNLEGGIVSEIRVREGDTVRKGDVLLRLDGKLAMADFEETRMRYLSDLAAAGRLEAEQADREPHFSPELKSEPALCAREWALWKANRGELRSGLEGFDRQLAQRREQLLRVQGELILRREESALLANELSLLEPLLTEGAMSEAEMLRRRREHTSVRVAVHALERQLPELEMQLAQISADRRRYLEAARARSARELAERRAQIDMLVSRLDSRGDRLRRTEVAAPMDGVVKQVLVTTVGAVAQPGAPLVELVPSEEALLVEVRVPPGDIGFVAPGQKAVLKVAAYDYAIYGGLEGRVDVVSADTMTERDGREFYRVLVSTSEMLRDRAGRPLPIAPGMTVSADVVTGRKSVLTYLFKPIVRGFKESFHER